MNVMELIERLEACPPDAEVLIASQPTWPLQNTVRGVATSGEIAEADDDGEDDDDDGDPCLEHGRPGCKACFPDGPVVVYLVEGDHPEHPYAPRGAWEVAS